MKEKTKRLLALLLALALALCFLSGCDDEGDWSTDGEEAAAHQGASLTVDQASGDLQITRPTRSKSAPMGEADTWTVFVYLCGSDLESRLLFGGSGTEDLKEMCAAQPSDAVRFVVQTGGAKRWKNDQVDAQQSQRFVVENGALRELWSGPQVDMGQADALADFLTWGVKEYPAEHMGVVLWDHGGGSVSGVCFDEQAGDDPLSLRELDAALLSVHEHMSDQFEFVGFDACLMGTVETAGLMASYARYMVASQESEPGCGWDYTALGNSLAQNPGADGAEAGKAICESYFAACKAIDSHKDVTLSVIDLSRMDPLLKAFNRFSKSMFRSGDDESVRSAMVRGIQGAECFGGSNKAEGFSNMVDLGGLVSACAQWTEGGEEVTKLLDQAVSSSVSGQDHSKATGLSVFYPLAVPNSSELRAFQDICVSPYYLSVVDRQTRGTVSEEEYDEGTWFLDGLWSLLGDYEQDEDSGNYEYEPEEEDYWTYVDSYEATGESERIVFEDEPQMDEDGAFWFSLTPESLDETADVIGCVYQAAPDGDELIDLGETWDVDADWDNGEFASQFDGYWLSLPDGQNLALYVAGVYDDGVVYSSPVLVNGEETNLRLRQNWDGDVTVEGLWDGVSESGACDRTDRPLLDGDEVIPLYDSFTMDGEEGDGYEGAPFTVDGSLQVNYDLLLSGQFWYSFLIEDTCGDYRYTDYADFDVEEDGSVYYYPEGRE